MKLVSCVHMEMSENRKDSGAHQSSAFDWSSWAGTTRKCYCTCTETFHTEPIFCCQLRFLSMEHDTISTLLPTSQFQLKHCRDYGRNRAWGEQNYSRPIDGTERTLVISDESAVRMVQYLIQFSGVVSVKKAFSCDTSGVNVSWIMFKCKIMTRLSLIGFYERERSQS